MGDDRPPQLTATKVIVIPTITNTFSKHLSKLVKSSLLDYQTLVSQLSTYDHIKYRFHSNSQLTDTVLFSILADENPRHT